MEAQRTQDGHSTPATAARVPGGSGERREEGRGVSNWKEVEKAVWGREVEERFRGGVGEVGEREKGERRQ